MKLLLSFVLTALAASAFSQEVVKATKTTEGQDICFYKQIQLKGYAYANIIGRCAWDPAMNGMNLSLVAQPEEPIEADLVELDYIRDVKLVENKSSQAQITVVQDSMKEDGTVFQIKKVIYVRSVDPKKGTFSIKK